MVTDVGNVAQANYNSDLWDLKIKSRINVFVQLIKLGTLGDLDKNMEIPKVRLNQRIRAYNTLARMREFSVNKSE